MSDHCCTPALPSMQQFRKTILGHPLNAHREDSTGKLINNVINHSILQLSNYLVRVRPLKDWSFSSIHQRTNK
eukprot:scaffold466328_cov15-Prasinocladus_malaysianus.AAC.1